MFPRISLAMQQGLQSVRSLSTFPRLPLPAESIASLVWGRTSSILFPHANADATLIIAVLAGHEDSVRGFAKHIITCNVTLFALPECLGPAFKGRQLAVTLCVGLDSACEFGYFFGALSPSRTLMMFREARI